MNHLDGQEDQLRELGAGSLQGSEEITAPSSSVENGTETTQTAHVRTEYRHELPSGDTGFFETSEDFGEEIS